MTYDEFVDANAVEKRMGEIEYNLIGLCGEVGEYANLTKKRARGDAIEQQALDWELGDVLYYVTKLAHLHGMTLAQLAESNRTKLETRYGKRTKKERVS